MVTLATTSEFLAALQHARHIDLQAYALAPGPVEDALIAAARRGAVVSVTLAGAPFAPAGPAAANERALARLRSAGVRTAEAAGAFHAKLARVDATLYLDDRNWSERGDTILRIPAQHASAVLALSKRRALAAEAALLATAHRGERVEIASESFGFASPLYSLLRTLAARGVAIRLCVARADLQPDSTEDRALARLAAAGVSVRLGDSSEKFALRGDRVWIGSANATYAAPGARDWGLQTRAAAVRAQLHARFERTWAHAREFVNAR
uniref:Phospholipase D-like domain-containing protein n=1 Tax=mine drainage metagenome TaxID=410659 RepID=E6Q6E4_9ZZZZ